MAAIISLQQFVSHYNVGLDDSDVFLSFLPLAHIFDRSLRGFFLIRNSFPCCRPSTRAVSPCPAPAPAASAACRASS